MKIHLGCGTVYLEGWTNVDVNGHLPEDRPDVLEANKTTYDNYYKEDVSIDDFKKGKHHKKEIVADIISDITKLRFGRGSIEAFLIVHMLEHFDLITAKSLLRDWYTYLKRGGYIEIHVPDTIGIVKGWNKDGDTDWMIRQLYGSQKNEFGIHKYGYTRDNLVEILKEVGFGKFEDLDSINSYPALALRAYK